MTGAHDYNNALTIFFISYGLAEPATNVLLKRLTPRVFFTGIILLWGLMMTLSAYSKLPTAAETTRRHQLTIAHSGFGQELPGSSGVQIPSGFGRSRSLPRYDETSCFTAFQDTDIAQGVNYYLSCWYKRSELGFRAALFFSAAALAGSFGGLLAAAIALMDGIGGMNGWAWIFIIEVSDHMKKRQQG
jgi:hypothetical protein